MAAIRIFVLVLFAVKIITGGTTGKISGRVTDSETKNGLPGVNVVVSGTHSGTATNYDGYFTILNVPPGQYEIQLSSMGYSPLVVQNVHVVMNRTAEFNIEMTPEALEMEAITVEAQRVLVVPDISASQTNFTRDEIKSLPVSRLTQVIGLQAGIEGLTIRGGGQSQSAFFVDGFLMNDERSNNPYTSVSLNSVHTVQVQTGGFNAEYGNIRSGVISVLTDDGNSDSYRGSFNYLHHPPAAKHFGPSLFNENSYFLRPFLDSAVCWTGTSQGSWDNHTLNQYPSFEGWNAVSDATMQDDNPANDLTPTGAQEVFKWQHRRNGTIVKPDYSFDGTISGPLPIFPNFFGKPRFNLSFRDEREQFIFPLSTDGYMDRVGRIKISSNPTSRIKLTMMFMKGEIQSVSPYNWKVTPTGSVVRSSYSVASLLNSTSGNSILFMPGYFSPTNIHRSMAGVKINHMLSEDTFYELVIQSMANEYDTYKITDRDTSKIYEIVTNYFVDEAPYGYWGYAESGIDGSSIGGWMNLGRDESVNTTNIIKLDVTSQLNFFHQLKAGVHAVFNNYDINSFTENPSMSTWRRSMVYEVSPYRLAGYIQDKLEYKGFIANLGLRIEHASANSNVFALSAYDELFKQGSGSTLESEAPREKADPVTTVSPRLGVSHPISESSKLYFNYGHFQSEPSSSYRFRIQRESNGLVTHFGNPNMSYQRTIAYEVGYSKSFRNRYLFNLAAYYKDVTDQPGWVYYQNIDASVQYYKATNNNYEDIRGLEISISKPVGKWISGFVNYTYMVSTSGYFGLTKYYQDPNLQREYEILNPYQEKPRPLPYARINIDIHSPRDFGPKFSGIYPLGGWNLNLLGTYKTGSYETYNPNSVPGIVDNVQWKNRYNLDLRFSKNFQIGTGNIEFFADVINAFNSKFLSSAGFSDNYDYIDYLESLRFSWEEGKEKGNDRIGEYREEGVGYRPYDPIDWENPTPEEREILDTKAYIDMPNIKSVTFLDPRKIIIGLSIRF